MILKEFIDKDGKEIDTEKVYFDTVHGVAQIHIIKGREDQLWYAVPDELDGEKLESVVKNLEQNDCEWIIEE